MSDRPRLRDAITNGTVQWYTRDDIRTATQKVLQPLKRHMRDKDVNALLLSFHAILHDSMYWTWAWLDNTRLQQASGASIGPRQELATLCRNLPQICFQFAALLERRQVIVEKSPIGRCLDTLELPTLEAILRAGAYEGPELENAWRSQVCALVEEYLPGWIEEGADFLLSLLGTLHKLAMHQPGLLTDISVVSFAPTSDAEAHAQFLLQLILVQTGAGLTFGEITSPPGQEEEEEVSTVSPELLALWMEGVWEYGSLDTGRQRRNRNLVELYFGGRMLPGCGSLACQNLSGPREESIPTRLCAGCRRMRYCSHACQRHAWGVDGDGHSLVCAAWSCL